ncbi:MAG: hypothetical protein HFJ32_03400 [Clostridia bacterium]|nr:hypothetical protein [Clostridia bacterium]
MKLKQKLIAAILIVIMLTSYMTILTDAVIAASVNLTNQSSKTNHTNVEFNSYFEEEAYSKAFEIGKEAKLYLKLKVSNTGYLKNGVVQFLNANFEVNSNSLKHDKVQSSSKDKIDFKQVNNGEEVIIEVPLTMITGETVDRDVFSKITTVKFTGTYMDENGKERIIEKEISNQVNWNGTAEVELAGEVSKYLPYKNENEKGIIVQARVRSGLKENSLPVQKTKLEVSLPEIVMSEENAAKPQRITVIANTTVSTNGKGSYEFNEANYKYNEETGKIEIEVENKEESGKIAWNKKAVDEYLINFIYTGEEVYNYIQEQLEKAEENAITGEIEVKVEITTYNMEQTKLTQSGKITYSIKKATGELIDTTISTVQKMSKGYLYANFAKKEGKKDTNYTVTYIAQIQDKALTNGVELQTITEKYIDENKNEYSSKLNNKDGIYSKTVAISEAVFTKMLGEEGKIEILNKAGEKLAEITKDLEKDNNGNYVVNIAEAEVNEIIIKTSKPITEGNIEIAVEKAILGNQEYTKEQMQEFKKMTLGVMTDNKTKETQISFVEPVSKAQISIGTQNLSTMVENKDVEIRVVLDTSSNENALYKNPRLQIILPENIEALNLKSVDLLLEDELKIKETKVVEQNGRKVILVELKGTQTKYMDNGTSNKEGNIISKGANIVIKADITFKRLTPSANSNIYLYYTNENTILFEKYYQNPNLKARSATSDTVPVGVATTGVTIVSPNGVVAENHMTGFKTSGSISNLTADKQTENIDANGNAKEVTIGGTVVNNYDNSIENVVILGRTPFSGNKAIDASVDLGTNFTMAMKNKVTTGGIDSSKIKVYYSTNGEANKNLIDTNNGWTEQPTNLAEIRSYLIVISGEIVKGTQISFDYKADLPANLSYNKEAYSNYKVYYDNKMADATLGETKVAGVIGLTTGQGPELQVSVSSNSNTAREGQIVRMKATVKNNGDIIAQNAKLKITAPEGTVHTSVPEGTKGYADSNEKEKTITLGDIKKGETIVKEYELRIKKGTTIKEIEQTSGKTEEKNYEEVNEYPGDKDISNIVRVLANNMSGEIKSEPYTLKILKGDLQIVNVPNINEEVVLRNGDSVIYRMEVKNISYDKDLDNVTLSIPLPQGVKVKEVYYTEDTFGINKKTENISQTENKILINIGNLKSSIKSLKETDNESDEPQLINIRDTVYVFMTLELSNFSGESQILVEATADGLEKHYSNSRKLLGETINLRIEQKALDNQYIKEGSNYTYHFTIENNSKVASISNVIEMPIPEGLKLVKAEYTYDGQTKTNSSARDGKLTINIHSLEAGGKIELAVTVKADLLPDKNDKEILTVATLAAQGIQTIESNRVKAIIEYDEEAHKGNQGGSDKPTQTGKHKITGTAWIDENKDGKRDETEELLAGVQVVLLYKSNSQIVKDETTGAEKITTTNGSGKYEFSNLKPDEYLVLFLYDAGKYSITDYQKEGVAESVNSDATSMKIVLNGEQRQAGVSNTIKITNDNVRDIDIGLFVAEKFDLRLDKYISKVTVTTPSNGTKTYNYNNSKITKREIASKDVGNSSLVIEYKIVVTNEGQVDGYVKKIIDYLPENTKFSSELNKDWYMSDNNGAVYNTALENEKILPGESKEVRLVLSYAINSKTIGKTINNNAEIYESYNELGLEDIDSIAANRLESEDDMSNADVIISVATGKVIIYTTFALAIIALLGFGVFEIKKRVLIKKEK